MKSKDKIRVLLGLLVIFIFQFFIPNVTGVLKDVSISTVAEKDCYVTDSIFWRDSNYGGVGHLIFGYQSAWAESYLHFNFTDKPTAWTKAEIKTKKYMESL